MLVFRPSSEPHKLEVYRNGKHIGYLSWGDGGVRIRMMGGASLSSYEVMQCQDEVQEWQEPED